MVKRQPRGIPVGGQFAGNSHDEAQSLTGVPFERTSLEGALEPYSLSPGDVPGLEEAWADRFHGADREPVFLKDVAHESAGIPESYDVDRVAKDPKTGIYAVTASEYSTYDDDDDRDLFKDQLFFVTDPDAVARMDAVDDDEERRIRDARMTLERIKSGKRTPWSILDEERYASAQADANRTAFGETSHRRAEESQRTFEENWSLANASADGEKIDWQAGNREIAGVSRPRYGEVGAPISVRIAADIIRDERQRQDKRERMESAMAEAQSLPAGPLRDFLLAERPERTYNTTEGTGRNKRTVPKKYRPTSDLVSEHKSATTDDGYTEKRYRELIASHKMMAGEHDTKVSETAAKAEEHRVNVDRLNRVGWTGTGDPPQRDSAHAEEDSEW